MKKVLIWISALIMVLGLAGCSTAPTEQKNTSAPTEKTVETESQTPEPTAEPTPEPVKATPSNWEIDYYVDDFGDDTENSYIRGTFFGSFSNTATTGSDLTVYVYYDPSLDSLCFRLLEYNEAASLIFSDQSVTLKTKINGETSDFPLIVDDRDCYLDSADVPKLRDALMAGGTISCAIEVLYENGNVDSRYRFDMDGAGFAELVNGENA